MYRLVKNEITNEIKSVHIIDGQNIISIPFDPANTDYQAYLKWVAEGNTPEPAENT
jgi:hypothetical protein